MGGIADMKCDQGEMLPLSGDVTTTQNGTEIKCDQSQEMENVDLNLDHEKHEY